MSDATTKKAALEAIAPKLLELRTMTVADLVTVHRALVGTTPETRSRDALIAVLTRRIVDNEVARQQAARPWSLANAAALAASMPTFRIPPRPAREAVRVGDLCKLVFNAREPDPESNCAGERMWVVVTERRPDPEDGGTRYRGALDSDPVMIEGLAPGDLVDFGAEHICDIHEPETGTDTNHGGTIQ